MRRPAATKTHIHLNVNETLKIDVHSHNLVSDVVSRGSALVLDFSVLALVLKVNAWT